MESGKVFSSNAEILPRSMGGIERGCYPNELYLVVWLYFFFSPLIAYNITVVFTHIVAFISMYLFSKRYIYKNQSDNYALITGLLFSVVPFWPSGFLSIAGQPLLLYAFLNILFEKKSWKNWAVIILFPFFSSLTFSNIFLGITLFGLFVIYSISKKQLNKKVVLALMIFGVLSLITEYRLFILKFVNGFESLREQWADGEGNLNIKGLIGVSLNLFLRGQYHFYGTLFPFALLLALLAIILPGEKRNKITLIVLIALGYSFAVISLLPSLEAIPIKKYLLSITPRFYGLLPLLWFIILGFSASLLLQKNKKWIVIGIFTITGLSSFFPLHLNDYQGANYEENSFYRTYISPDKGYARFDEYYQVSEFKSIKEKIAPGDYYIVCLGFVPEIAQYNGYNTQGGYHYFYSMKYNKLVKDITSKEMKKLNRKSIGRKCFFESAEMNQGKEIIKNLEYDFEALKNIGTKYIFSTRKIEVESLSLKEAFPEQGMYVYCIN